MRVNITGPEEGQCIGCTLLPGYNIQVCKKDTDGITRKFAFKVCQVIMLIIVIMVVSK